MSKIGELLVMLQNGKHTKEELAAATGLKESTVGVQMSYHLKMKGYEVKKEKTEAGWVYFIDAPARFVDEGDDDEESPEPKEVVDEQEPTHEELKEVEQEGDDKHATDAELEALLEE